MSTHSVSTRLNAGAHAHTSTYAASWPILTIWDDAAEFVITFPCDVSPAHAVSFANALTAAAQRFAAAVDTETTRRATQTRNETDAQEAA